MYGGDEDLRFDAVQHLGVYDRCRRISAHAPGVGTGVTVVGPLMVLGCRQGQDGLTVRDGQHADFLSVEAFFDDELVAGVAELLVAADATDGLYGFGAAGTDKHAFARRQSVGFDDHRHVLAIGEVHRGVIDIAKDVIIAGGHVGVPQQVLAKDLAALKLGRVLSRAEDSQSRVLKGIHHAADQRQFGPDDGQLHLVLLGKLHQPRNVGRGDVHVFGIGGRAGVSRRDEDALDARALAQLPRQRMFPATFTNN